MFVAITVKDTIVCPYSPYLLVLEERPFWLFLKVKIMKSKHFESTQDIQPTQVSVAAKATHKKGVPDLLQKWQEQWRSAFEVRGQYFERG